MASSTPGGGGALAVVIGAPLAAGIVGYFVGGPKHHVLGVLGGIGLAFVGLKVMASGGTVPNDQPVLPAKPAGT